MAAPTAAELLELYDELNFPSPVKFRAALLRQGYKVRLKDVEEFVKSQTPTQLFKKHPLYAGKTIATRSNERWFVDLIDYTNNPAGKFNYVLLAIDAFSRHAFARPLRDKKPASFTSAFRQLVAEYGTPKEVNADAEFEQAKTFQTYLGTRSIEFRGKRNVNDLAVLDSNMQTLKKMVAKDLQANNVKNWATRLPKVVRGFNRQSHEALLGEPPEEAHHRADEAPKNKHLGFELREKAGRQAAAQNAVVSNSQRNMLDNGAFRTYIGRPDARKRADRPNYSGKVHLVDSVHGNVVKSTDGTEHSLTTVRPVPTDSENTNITLRLVGSKQQEKAKREKFKKFAEKLEEIVAGGWVWTPSASSQLRRDPAFGPALGRMTFANFVRLFPDKFELKTSASGGASKVFPKT